MSYVSLDKNSDLILLEPRVGWGTVSPVIFFSRLRPERVQKSVLFNRLRLRF